MDVADAPPEIVVLHPVEDLPVFVHGHADRPFGVNRQLPDVLQRTVDEFAIAHDHDVDIDDVERLHAAAQIAEFTLQLEELLFRFPQGLTKTLDLRGNQARIAKIVKGNLRILAVEKIGPADDDAR